jgi:hypothetical protein
MAFRIIAVILCSGGMFLSACKKDKHVETIDLGYDYFPNEKGSYIIYDVDSIHYNDFTKRIDTIRFELKEIVESVFQDNEGRPTLRIERYKKFSNQTDFKLTDVWVANRNNRNAEKVEENTRYVKLVFPVVKGSKWNGNAFNAEGELEYVYKQVNAAATIGSLQFDSTLTVYQQADSNLIEKKLKYEIYAKHVGMIFKKDEDVESKDSVINVNVPFDKRITTGNKVTYTIKSFGK